METSPDGTILCTTSQLNLDSLVNGQSFRWKKEPRDGILHYMGIASHRLWDVWRASDEEIYFKVTHRFDDRKTTSDREALCDYFQLDVDLEGLYQRWTQSDVFFREAIETGRLMRGVRILKQEPLEALMAFICSANNNIGRISKMVNRLSELYGTEATVQDKDGPVSQFYDFPNLYQLQLALPGMANELRASGFGYRSAYIAGAVDQLIASDEQLSSGGENSGKERLAETDSLWLNNLRAASYDEAKRGLLSLPGVGPKVADCVCLMGLQKHQALPVDTHIFRLTSEFYAQRSLPDLSGCKSSKSGISGKNYELIGNFYRSLFGDYAGWAQSVLFTLALKKL